MIFSFRRKAGTIASWSVALGRITDRRATSAVTTVSAQIVNGDTRRSLSPLGRLSFQFPAER
jgi:hypothetical protein